MAFVVTYQGEMSERHYRSYVEVASRRLLKQGLSLDRVPRTRHNGHTFAVHDTRDQADSIAQELNASWQEDNWEVAPVEWPTDVGPLCPLTLEMGRSHQGLGFCLDVLVATSLRKHHPGAAPHQRVWLTTEQEAAFTENGIRELAKLFLPLLTGLTTEQMQSFGGFEVVDPVKAETLVPFTPFVSNGTLPPATPATHCETLSSPAHCTPAPLG